jgi:outer membrane protein assembly factor BamB
MPGIILTPPRRPPDEITRDAVSRRRAGMLLLIGALIRVFAYALPWVLATGERTVSMSVLRLGPRPVSLLITGAVLVIALAYFKGARWVHPRLLISIGILALIGWIWDVAHLTSALTQARVHLQAQGFGSIKLGAGAGPLAELVSAILLLGGGTWALRIHRRTRPDEDLVSSAPVDPFVSWGWLLAVGLVLLLLVFVPVPVGPQTASPLDSGFTPNRAPTARHLGPVPPPAHPGGPDAIAYQGDVAHDGNVADAGVTPPLTRAWSRSLGLHVSYPLIAKGRLFATAVTSHGSTTSDTQLMALDLATGRTLWSHRSTDIYGFLGLAYDSGSVFTVNGVGQVTRYDAATGRAKWQVQMTQSVFNAPPTAWGGHLYVVGQGGGGTLFAIDEHTGRVLWSSQLNAGDRSSPSLSGENVFVGFGCSNSYLFRAHDGTPRWNPPDCLMGGSGTAAIYRDRIYVHGDGRTWILNVSNGLVVDHVRAGTIPAFSGDTAYFLKKHRLVALSVSTLRPMWSFMGDGALISAPLVAGSTVYIASSKGHLYALQPNGKVVGTVDLGAPVLGPDEHVQLMTAAPGMNAGDGFLAVAASGRLVVYR